MKVITKRLRVLRAERDLSQRDTATKAGMSVDRYWKIENGYADPTDAERQGLARALRLQPDDIFETAHEARS